MGAATSVEFPCPGCPRRLRAAPGHAGRRVRCPACGTTAVVPYSLDDPEPPSANRPGRDGDDRDIPPRRRQRPADRAPRPPDPAGLGPLFWLVIALVPVPVLVAVLTAAGTFSTVRASYPPFAFHGFADRFEGGGGALDRAFAPNTVFSDVRVETSFYPLAAATVLFLAPAAAFVGVRQYLGRVRDAALPWWPAAAVLAALLAVPVAATLLRPTKPPRSFSISVVRPLTSEVEASMTHVLGLLLMLPVVGLVGWALHAWWRHLGESLAAEVEPDPGRHRPAPSPDDVPNVPPAAGGSRSHLPLVIGGIAVVALVGCCGLGAVGTYLLNASSR